jgi:hypothetical protein
MPENEMAALIEIPLTQPERQLLLYGMNEWGGPARCTEELARAMGFPSRAHMYSEFDRLKPSLRNKQPLSVLDWTRMLVATEIVFVSGVFGSGLDWCITTGCSDVETIELLRQLQRKLSAVTIELRDPDGRINFARCAETTPKATS